MGMHAAQKDAANPRRLKGWGSLPLVSVNPNLSGGSCAKVPRSNGPR
jgi:hypothetical protein